MGILLTVPSLIWVVDTMRGGCRASVMVFCDLGQAGVRVSPRSRLDLEGDTPLSIPCRHCRGFSRAIGATSLSASMVGSPQFASSQST